jgi:hypothetical protein
VKIAACPFISSQFPNNQNVLLLQHQLLPVLDTMSFSRELMSGPSCRDQQRPQQQQQQQQPQQQQQQTQRNEIENSKIVEQQINERKESLAVVFNSQDFGKFLSTEFPKTFGKDSGSLFLSKDTPLPSFDNSIFKSKDAFSNLFASKDWEMKFPHEDLKLPTEELPPLKTMAPTPLRTMASAPPMAAQTVPPVTGTSREDLKAALSSKDWMPMSTLGNHVDVSYNPYMFNGSDSESDTNDIKETDLTADILPAKTDWNSMFFSQLQLVPPSPSILSERMHSISSGGSAPGPDEEFHLPIEEFHTSQPLQAEEIHAEPVPSAPEAVEEMDEEDNPEAPKKRKRRPRKKIVPKVKEYVEPTPVDVLLGRGGRSNHHPGNKRYREEVQNLQSWYLGVEDKNEKTDLSQCLVDYVHSYDGRFLYKDENGWYVVPNIIARRKASQALREDNDAEKRAAKRARFLQKKELEVQKTTRG